MGRGRSRSRKLQNFATFRLLPRSGAAYAADRVFVRVDGTPSYSVPGFADAAADDDEDAARSSSGGDERNRSSSTGGLPERVRCEIMELGLPDDGYDYLRHVREIRPSYSSSGGGSSAAFFPSHRPARFGLPLDVKAYDARLVVVGSSKVAAAAAAVRMVEEAIDVDVADLLEETNVPPGAPEDDDLDEDFVIVANQLQETEDLEEDLFILADQPEEEDQMDVGGASPAAS